MYIELTRLKEDKERMSRSPRMPVTAIVPGSLGEPIVLVTIAIIQKGVVCGERERNYCCFKVVRRHVIRKRKK